MSCSFPALFALDRHYTLVDRVTVFLESCEKAASRFIEANAIGYHPAEKTDAQQIETHNGNDEPLFNCTFIVCVIHLPLQSYKPGRASIIIEISELATAPVYWL